VEDDILRAELDRVTSELAAAKTEFTSLGAKIAGLEAQKQALARGLADKERHSAPRSSETGKYRTEAIVDLLTAAASEMSIKDVIGALHDNGRTHEIYDNVAADLAYLAERGRIVRLRRGVYTRPDRIVIPITQGSLNNSYIPLANHLGFFPADAIGRSNGHDAEGALLTLHFAGLPEAVETDIDGTHNFFRRRGPVREFFAHHQLKPGEKVAIEKQSEHEYHVLPVR
jgi:hypothetical protein